MQKEQVQNNVAYVFAVYQLKKLKERGLLTNSETAQLDKKISQLLGADYNVSCQLL